MKRLAYRSISDSPRTERDPVSNGSHEAPDSREQCQSCRLRSYGAIQDDLQMRNHLILCALLLTPFHTFAGAGPTSVGEISIGMNIKQYIAAIRINPVDCNRVKSKDGNPRSDIKYLTSRRKSLCNTYRFDKTGSIEHIEIGSLAYDVVAANYESSSVIKAIGNSSKAIFFEDRLISFEIYAPKVDVETLTSKYSTPKAIDKRAIRVCQNRIGNEFRNNVGDLDAIWTNGEISSILRRVISPPHTTCTDGSDLQYYILEHTKKVKVLDDVIDKYSSEVARQTAKDSKF